MKSAEPHFVLVVEDDPDVLELVSVILARDGHRVVKAIDGEDALNQLDARPYDLVLLDIMLPIHNGFEVYDKIRALDPQPRVIVLSAIARYVGDRFHDDVIVLQKPFTHEALKDAIDRSLQA